MPDPGSPSAAKERAETTNRERAINLLGECGPKADKLLSALTYAVLALSDPAPPSQCTCTHLRGDDPLCVYHGRTSRGR